EDFANYLEHIPGAMFRIGAATDPSQAAQLHTPTFDVDEQALAIGTKVMARTVVLWSETE
ncbi:MAG: amidohydrolase, partial [Pirellulales bacterium]